MTMTVYTLEQPDEWDAQVRSFREYDTYWLSGYAKAFQIHGDGEPLLFYYEDGTARGISVVMKRDVAKDRHFQGMIPEGLYFDFATPYGYGGWLLEGGPADGLMKAYEAWAKDHGIISEFVRFHPMIGNEAKAAPYYEVVRLGEVVHLELQPREAVWENISSKRRNEIRKAQKNGVEVSYGRSEEDFETFRRIYNETMAKDEAEEYYYFGPEFYRSVYEDLSENSLVFKAEKDGEVIASAIMLYANGRMNYHLSGSLTAYNHLSPTSLILLEAARWGAENGFQTFYLGGGVGSGEDGLFRFKRSFYRGELTHFFIGKKIFDPERYEELLRMRTEAERPGFFPAYRA